MLFFFPCIFARSASPPPSLPPPPPTGPRHRIVRRPLAAPPSAGLCSGSARAPTASTLRPAPANPAAARRNGGPSLSPPTCLEEHVFLHGTCFQYFWNMFSYTFPRPPPPRPQPRRPHRRASDYDIIFLCASTGTLPCAGTALVFPRRPARPVGHGGGPRVGAGRAVRGACLGSVVGVADPEVTICSRARFCHVWSSESARILCTAPAPMHPISTHLYPDVTICSCVDHRKCSYPVHSTRSHA